MEDSSNRFTSHAMYGEDEPLTTHLNMNEVSSGLYHVVVLAPSGPQVARVVWMR